MLEVNSNSFFAETDAHVLIYVLFALIPSNVDNRARCDDRPTKESNYVLPSFCV